MCIKAQCRKVVHVGSKRRAAAHHCTPSTVRETGDLGLARHGRLVLRALLPSYYRHVSLSDIGLACRKGNQVLRNKMRSTLGMSLMSFNMALQQPSWLMHLVCRDLIDFALMTRWTEDVFSEEVSEVCRASSRNLAEV